ncbi:MAG: hypothetical protein EA427_07525 [Spirochaetaceae bacterium]|nr:MAG: hypothetical protein EA427_07525 [Spirochaetaceae bacterium]
MTAHTTFQGERVNVSMEVDGSIDGSRTGDPFGLTLEMSRVRGSHFTLTDQTFRLERRGETIALERVRSGDALALGATLDLGREEILLNVRSEDFAAASLVTFYGPWSDFNEWIATPITTTSLITLDLDGTPLEARGTLEGRIAHSSLPEPFSLQTSYSFRPDRFDFSSLLIRTARGEALFTGSWRPGTIAPDGTVRLRHFSYAGSPVLDGIVDLSGSRTLAGASAERISVDTVPLYNVVARLQPGTPAGSRYHTLEGAFSLEADAPNHLRGTIRFADPEDFTGEMNATDLPVAAALSLYAAFGEIPQLPAPVAGARVSGAIRFDRREGDTIVRVPYLAVRDDQNHDRLGAFSGEYRNGEIAITHYYMREQGITVTGTGTASLYRDGSLTFETDFSLNHVHYSVGGRYTRRGDLHLSGPYDFSARITRTAGGGYALIASARNAPLPLGQARLSISVEGTFFDRSNWYLNIRELEAWNLPIPGPGGEYRPGRIVLAAAVQPETIQMAITEFSDGTSTLAGTVETRYFFTGSGLDLSITGRMGALEGDEQYRFAARYTEDGIALDLRFGASPLQRFSSRVERGTVQGTIQVVGSLDRPEIRAFLESERLILNGSGASFRVLFQSDDRVLRVTQSEIGYGTIRVDVPQLILERQEGTVEGFLRFQRLEQDVRLSLTGRTDPLPELSLSSLRATAVDLIVRAAPGVSDELPENPQAWHYELVRTAEATTITRMDGAIQAEIDDGGVFFVLLGGDLPYRGRAEGVLGPDRVEVTVSNIHVEMARIPFPPALRQFHVSRGTVTGSLRLLGPPGDPDLFGTLTVRDLELTTPFSPDALGPLDTALIFEEKLVRLQQTRSRIGPAPVDLSAQILVNRLALEQFELVLDMPGEAGVHVVSGFGPLNVDGYARGNLVLSGTPETLDVTGGIIIYGTELAVAPDFDQTAMEGPNATVDLRVRTGRAVRFIWPDTELPIIRSNFATGQEVRLKVDTRENAFSLDGTLAIQSGDVYYFDRNFLLRSGRVDFRETQEDFDPRITARAELRETTPDGPVRIYLVADGQRLSEFSPRFDSSPPLESAEIVAILGGSILQVGTEGSVTLPSALLSTSDVVTQFAFFRQFENAVRDQLDLDLFAIRTSIVQNILLTAITPVDDQVQQQATPSLGTYLNNTSIFMGRYIGDSVFGQLVLQMRASDPLAFPEDDGIQRLGGVLIDSEISLEWQTPFFLLEWNFAPQNPEELFIRDNTFSFLWSFSY